MELAYHRTLLNNLRAVETVVALEHSTGMEKGVITDLVFDAADPDQDLIELTDPERPHEPVHVLWGQVRGVWTRAWNPGFRAPQISVQRLGDALDKDRIMQLARDLRRH